MAQSTAHSSSVFAPLGIVADIFAGIFNAMIRVGEANARVQQIKALSYLSDDELAERGLRREDIVRHVMNHYV